MYHHLYLSPVAVAIALAISGPAKAAEPLSLQHATFTKVKEQFTLILSDKQPNKLTSAKTTPNTLQFISKNVDKARVAHVRMQQYYAGVPVEGGYAIVHDKQAGNGLLNGFSKNASMNGTVYQGLQDELGAPAASFINNADAVLTEWMSQYSKKNVRKQKITPMVYIDDNNKAHWAYEVSVMITHKHATPSRPTAIIDAETHKPFVEWNDIKTKRVDAKAMGFGGNTKAGEFKYDGSGLPFLEITRDNRTKNCYMENKDVKVIDMLHLNDDDFSNPPPTKAMKFKCKGTSSTPFFMSGYQADGYDKENGAYSPSNDALYSGYVIKHMYHDWYGLEALTKNGKPMQLVMRVHYDDRYENAFWDGEQMTFGDGEDMLYPLVSLGIAAHEISHGFTEQHSNLRYRGQSGGMNEAFSDMAAKAAEYYSLGDLNDWMLGSEIMKEASGMDALRFMDKPSKDGSSIDYADEYYPGLDVHYSSGVYNRMFYLLSTTPGWTPRLAFDVMVKANVAYWTPTSDFKAGACGVLSATVDEKRPVEDVKAALTKVGIDFSACKIAEPVPEV